MISNKAVGCIFNFMLRRNQHSVEAFWHPYTNKQIIDMFFSFVYCYSITTYTAVLVTNNGATLTDSASNEMHAPLNAKISLKCVFLKPHEGWSPNTTSLLLFYYTFFFECLVHFISSVSYSSIAKEYIYSMLPDIDSTVLVVMTTVVGIGAFVLVSYLRSSQEISDRSTPSHSQSVLWPLFYHWMQLLKVC